MGFFHQYFIKVHKPLQNLMIKHYERYWRENVIAETPPPVREYEDIRKLIPAPKGTIIANKEIERLSAEYRGIRAEISKSKKRQDELKALILDWMTKQAEAPIDDDSVEKWILRSKAGKKLHSYNGKTFR